MDLHIALASFAGTGVEFLETAVHILQLSVAALLLGFLPILNALTTKSHLLVTLPNGQWTLAGVDLTGLAVSILLSWTARRLGRPAPEAPKNRLTSTVVPDGDTAKA
jgi:membrane protein implicated in regulation of membrane protease activity